MLFNCLNGILESTDFIPESSQNAKNTGQKAKTTVLFRGFLKHKNEGIFFVFAGKKSYMYS